VESTVTPAEPAEATARDARPAEPTPDEFGALFERHADEIYNFCFRRTADWALAEDLTSVVFLEAWRKRSRVDLVNDPPLPWLYGVATNVLRNHSRSLRRFRAALRRLPRPEHGPDIAEEATDRLADEQRMRAILGLVGRLPRSEREVLELCVWAELSYEQAASALELPVGTVRSRLSRARSRLTELAATAELQPRGADDDE
jgi:RNA polymerase sigma factor (sigma-70 family)